MPWLRAIPRGALLRLDRDYRAAWQAHAARPVYEDGTPFPVRIRSDADRIAERDWGLMAWEDPDSNAVSAIFDMPMLEGEGSATAPPLLAMLESGPPRMLDSSRPPGDDPEPLTPKMPSCVKDHAKWMPIAIHSRRVRR